MKNGLGIIFAILSVMSCENGHHGQAEADHNAAFEEKKIPATIGENAEGVAEKKARENIESMLIDEADAKPELLNETPHLPAVAGLRQPLTIHSDGKDFKAFFIPPYGGPSAMKGWILYAPAYDFLPSDGQHGEYLHRLREQGIGIAGIEVGENYGGLGMRKAFKDLTRYMIEVRKFTSNHCWVLQSRGGMIGLKSLIENPDLMPRCIALIYPVTDLRQWLGIETFAPMWGLTVDEMTNNLPRYNIHENVVPILVKNGIQTLNIHGDSDDIVTHTFSQRLDQMMDEAGGKSYLKIYRGEGHNSSPTFFRNNIVTAFLFENLLP